MNEKHKSLKTAYGMLSIPVIISAIILMVLSGGAIIVGIFIKAKQAVDK